MAKKWGVNSSPDMVKEQIYGLEDVASPEATQKTKKIKSINRN